MQIIPSKIVHKASLLFGLESPAQFYASSHLHSSANVFRGNNTVLKICLQSTADQVSELLQRIGFADHLQSTGIHTQSFLSSINSNHIETLEAKDNTYYCYAWSWIPGNTMNDIHPKDLASYYADWARLAAECHKAAQGFDGNSTLSWHDEWQNIYDRLLYPDVQACYKDLKTNLEQYPATRANFGFIHNDIHPKNILLSQSAMHLIDFDRSCRHFFVQDIANAIYSEYSRIGFHSRNKASLLDMREFFVKPFIRSYIATYPTLTEDLIALEQFISYRRIVMFAIFHDEVKAADPAYLEEFRQEIVQNTEFLPFSMDELLSDINLL